MPTNPFSFETEFNNSVIITFDLFKTLITEPFLNHSDIFDLMSNDVQNIIGLSKFPFKEIRLLSQKNAELNNQHLESIDLNLIYFEFQKITKFHQSLIMEIEKIELCYEYKFYNINTFGSELFQKAIELNKKIVIIADTYLPRFIIEELLSNLNYRNYHELFVSSEIGLSIKTGNLLNHISKKCFCDAKYLLHIGYNQKNENILLNELGFSTINIISNVENYKNSEYYSTIWQKNESKHILSTRLIQGLLSNKLLKNKKEDFFTQPHMIGYFGLGPLILGFIQWILQNSNKDYIKHIYFLSENGDFLKKSYDLIAKNYNNSPLSYNLLYSSRINKTINLTFDYILYHISSQNYSNISLADYFNNNYGINIANYFKLISKYGLSKDMIIDKNIHEQQVFSLFEELIPAIKEIFQNEKNYFNVYLKYQNLPNPDKSTIIDVLSHNSQITLSEISKQKINGYYLFTFLEELEKINENNMLYSSYLGNYEEKTFFHNQVENLLKNTKETFFSFELKENSINPIFLDDNIHLNKELILEIQNSAMDFIIDFDSCYNKYMPDLIFEPNQCVQPLKFLFNEKNLQNVLLKNNFNQVTNIESNKNNNNFLKSVKNTILWIKKTI